MNTEELLEKIASFNAISHTQQRQGFKTRLKNLVVRMNKESLRSNDWRSLERQGYAKLLKIEDHFVDNLCRELSQTQRDEAWTLIQDVRRWISDDFATVASAAYKHRLEAKAAKLDREMRQGRFPADESIMKELKVHGCGNGAWQ